MGDPMLVFITGPTGAGKSASAEAVADKWPGTCAVINFDHIRRLVRSGYAEPAFGWNDEAARQWELARRVSVAMARAYLSGGVSVVLEVFATPDDFPGWQQLFGDLARKAVALVPELDVVLARNDQRSGVTRLPNCDMRRNYEWSTGWADVPGVDVIDNSTKDIGDVAEEILRLSAA
jgi:AAA domain